MWAVRAKAEGKVPVNSLDVRAKAGDILQVPGTEDNSNLGRLRRQSAGADDFRRPQHMLVGGEQDDRVRDWTVTGKVKGRQQGVI